MVANVHIDHPSLFAELGFHEIAMEDVEKLCVEAFPSSKTRAQIMTGLKTFVQKLIDSQVVGELWLDGSFFTHKIDPQDVDIVLKFNSELLDSGSDQQQSAVRWVIENQKKTLLCDSYILVSYERHDPLFVEYEWWKAYWHAKWGFSREGDPKGIAVLRLVGA